MHAADWLPTLVSLASGQDWKTFIPATEPEYQYGDGMDVQAMLTSVGGKSPRNWLVYEAHPTLTEVRPAALPVLSNTVQSQSARNLWSNRDRTGRPAPNWLLVAWCMLVKQRDCHSAVAFRSTATPWSGVT